MANNQQRSNNTGDFVTSSPNWLVIPNSIVNFKNSYSGGIVLGVNFSYTCVGNAVFQHSLYVGNGIINQADSLGEVSDKNITDIIAFEHFLSGFGAPDINIGIALKVLSGQVRIILSDPSLTYNFMES